MNDPFDPLHPIAQSRERTRSGERDHFSMELQSAVLEGFAQVSEEHVSEAAAQHLYGQEE